MSRLKIRRQAPDPKPIERTPAKLRKIEGEEPVLAWLRQGGVRTFRYRVNKPGFIFLGILSFITAVLALVLLSRSALALPIHWAGFTVLMAFTTGCMWTISRWTLFAHRHYIALTDEELFLGYARTGVIIPRSLVNARTFGLDRMRTGRISASVPIELETYRDDIHLFGPFANLDMIEPFIEEMLHDIQTNEVEEEVSEVSEDPQDGISG